MRSKLKVIFMGTPDFVVPVAELLHANYDLLCVYTQPPRAKGRKQILEKTPVHEWAEWQNIPVHHPNNFKADDDVALFESHQADIAVVAAYGLLLPQVILDAPKAGCVNIHPSLLPRWRGPSPIQYAIWKGDAQTGVSVMQLEKAMDAGPILAQSTMDIGRDNFETLNQKLWTEGVTLLDQVLQDYDKKGVLNAAPQSEEGVTYCKLLTKDDGKIDWAQTAQEIDCQIRGLNPWPGTWCLDEDGKRLKILKAEIFSDKTKNPSATILEGGLIACGEGTILKLLTLQPENKKSMNVSAALNGGYLKAGSVLR